MHQTKSKNYQVIENIEAREGGKEYLKLLKFKKNFKVNLRKDEKRMDEKYSLSETSGCTLFCQILRAQN